MAAAEQFQLDFSREVAQLGELINMRKEADNMGVRLCFDNAILGVLNIITEKAKKQREVYERTFVPQPGPAV